MNEKRQTTSLQSVPQHPARHQLTHELHARPFEEISAPTEIFLFASLTGEGGDPEEWQRLSEFCAGFGVQTPETQVKHFSAVLGAFRFRWERHTEFTTCTVITHGLAGSPFNNEPPAELISWLGKSKGELLVATRLSIQSGGYDTKPPNWPFVKASLVCSQIASHEAQVWTDLRIHKNGYNHILLQDRSLSQLLIKMRARQQEGESITGTIEQDRALLEELSQLSAEIEEMSSLTAYRFAASRAYYALTISRIVELDEKPVSGFQTIGEFLDRRLNPAMRTCESASARLDDLALRANRAGSLLRTRIDLVLEQQNHDLLDSMNQRARLQLRLQETVEGLSIAAITYYLVGLVAYGAKSLQQLQFNIEPDLISGIAIIPIALLVGFGVKQIRRSLNATQSAGMD
jgi:uncharacterized membrane-anchored protein